MEAVDVARIRTQVRLAELALDALLYREKESLDRSPNTLEARKWLNQASEALQDVGGAMAQALAALNAGKPPRDRG